MNATIDDIKALKVPTNASKILRTIYFLSCGEVLDGRKATDNFDEVALHSTVDDIRSLGFKVMATPLTPGAKRCKYWLLLDQETLNSCYRYLVEKGCDSSQIDLFGEGA